MRECVLRILNRRIGFLEQIVEQRACVVGVARRRRIRRGKTVSVAVSIGIAIGLRSRVSRDSHTRLEQLACVGAVLRRNARRNRLQTLEACRRFEMRTLLAAMQRDMAFGTVRLPVSVGGQRSRAVIASRCGYRLHQPRQARSSDIDRGTRTLRPRALFAPLAISGIATV